LTGIVGLLVYMALLITAVVWDARECRRRSNGRR